MLDRIERMRAFAQVADSESFTLAAERLGVTTGQLSKNVKALEDELGVRLLHRTTRKVRMTETGRAFHPRAVRLVEDFDELRAAAREEHLTPMGALKVTAPTTFGELHVAALAARFLEAHPEMSIDLHLTDRHVGLIDEGFDLAIRIGQLESSSLIARKLGAAALRVCGAPELFERIGRPGCPEDLVDLPCILDTNSRPADAWRFRVDGAETSVRVAGRFRVNSATASRRLALEGAGIACCPDFVVREDLAAGRLVEALDAFAPEPLGIYAVYLESRHLSAKVRAFVDFAAAELPASVARPGAIAGA